jgi:hypothetical protein
MAGWLRTYLIYFTAAHLAIILFSLWYGPLDLLKDEGDLTTRQVELGTGFYGVLMGLLIFGWLMIWLIVFYLMRDRDQAKRKRKP